jgi:addiction module HigA family antidote
MKRIPVAGPWITKKEIDYVTDAVTNAWYGDAGMYHARFEKAFAEHIGVPIQRVNEIVRGRRGVSSETAWLFAVALGTTPEFWMNLQAQHDLARSKPKRSVRRLRKSA